MRHFMDHLQYAFYESSGWDPNNFYSSLNASAQALLFFDTPRGLRLNVSSLSSPNSASSYDFGSVGYVNGSLSYLYSSLGLRQASSSTVVNLRNVVPGYRRLRELSRPENSWAYQIWHRGIRVDKKDTLVYGRLYLPRSTLEALYLRRLNPTRQVQISCVSDSTLDHGGTVLALLQQDFGKFSTEYLYSTDSALLGLRGLYNFGYDPRKGVEQDISPEHLYGRLSAGCELYYGLLNKSGGMSAGLRFTTLPKHSGFPYTTTLTLNPLMGNLSSSYAVKAGPNLALCTQFDFNFYSYESDVLVGFELWRKQQESDTAWARNKLREGWSQQVEKSPEDDVSGVLKVRWDNKWRLGLLWEGRLQSMLFSTGISLDLRRREQVFSQVGAELHFTS